jgi:hypothetical protein
MESISLVLLFKYDYLYFYNMNYNKSDTLNILDIPIFYYYITLFYI